MERFTLDESYVICGVGNGFRALMGLFPEIKIRCCLDARADAITLPDFDLFSYEILKNRNISQQRFIITAGSELYAEIKETLLTYGVEPDNISSLMELLLFWGMRYREKIFLPVTTVILLTQCNLRCRACSQFVPYIKKFRYNSIEDIEENLSQYFRVFGFVDDLQISGGETLLYRELGQLCAYIRKNFQDRYHELKIFTNGLIIPQEENIEEISKVKNTHVLISDYTQSIQKSPNRLIDYLEKYHIKYTLNSSFGQSAEYKWFDLGDPRERKIKDAQEARRRFETCSLICPTLLDHKIYYCSPSWSAVLGEITELPHPEICLDLNLMEQMNLEEKMDYAGKFFLGFIDNGYLEFCQFCNGYGKNCNTHFATAGEQMPSA